MPIHVDGVLVHAMSGSELSHVRTEFDPLRILPIVPPHPVQPNRESAGHGLSLAKTLGVLSFTPLTMLQACAQAVDFKVGHHFGEGQGLHDDIENRLALARKAFGHPTTKGDASENVWLEMLRTYLPRRYQATKAHVVDSRGAFSEQIDVVIFDQQYSPFIFNYQGQTVVPAESVYGAFEAKQTIDGDEVKYARRKVASVRKLHRTSLPIPHAGGTYPAKTPTWILGGLLTLESKWNPPLGDPLMEALSNGEESSRLDLGCVAARGMFGCDQAGCYTVVPQGKPATAFLFELIARLQATATVPMIDIRAYAKWLGR